MIDFHCHMLPGTDDGPADSTGAQAIAAVLADVGFTKVHCTPHMLRGAYATNAAEIRVRVSRLGELIQSSTIHLKLAPGAEYYFDEYLPQFLADPLPLDSNYILVESPMQASAPVIIAQVNSIQALGLTPLIAHPERTPLFNAASGDQGGLFAKILRRSDPRQSLSVNPVIANLMQQGCRFQGNLGSFAGIYGERIRQNALTLLDQGIYNCLGSDAHRHDGLEKSLRKGIAAIQERIGRELTEKLLAGDLLH